MLRNEHGLPTRRLVKGLPRHWQLSANMMHVHLELSVPLEAMMPECQHGGQISCGRPWLLGEGPPSTIKLLDTWAMQTMALLWARIRQAQCCPRTGRCRPQRCSVAVNLLLSLGWRPPPTTNLVIKAPLAARYPPSAAELHKDKISRAARALVVRQPRGCPGTSSGVAGELAATSLGNLAPSAATIWTSGGARPPKTEGQLAVDRAAPRTFDPRARQQKISRRPGLSRCYAAHGPAPQPPLAPST